MLRQLLCILFLLLLPFAMGLGCMNGKRKNKRIVLSKCYNRGMLLLLLPATVLCVIAGGADWGFSLYRSLTLGCLILLCISSIVVWIWKKRKKKYRLLPEKSPLHWEWVLGIVFLAALFFLQLWICIRRSARPGADLTLGIINTIHTSGAFYTVNPATGMSYQSWETVSTYSPLLGFYAMLSSLFGIPAVALVYRVIPFWMLFFFYSVCMEAGEYFFPGSMEKKLAFVAAAQMLNLFGTGGRWFAAYSLLCEPWTANSILCTALLPLLLLQMGELVIQGVTGKRMMFLGLYGMLIFSISDLGRVFAVIDAGILLISLAGRKIYEYGRIDKLRS